MSLALITLPTNKSISTVSDHVRKIGQGEKGQKLDVIVTDANGSGYDLTNRIITFSENKESGKIVSDNEAAHFNVTDEKAGRFTYTLADAVYAASGIAWFDISSKDGDVIDTTKSFNIDVIQDETIHVNNDNYVSSLTALETHYKAVIQKTEDDRDALFKKWQADIDQLIKNGNTNIQTVIDNANQLITSWKSELSNTQQALEKLQNDWKNQTAQINADYDAQKKAIQSAADNQLSANKTASDKAIVQIETDKQAAIKQANTDFQAKLASIQSDYNSWKTSTIADFQSQINKLASELQNDEKTQADLKEAIDAANKAIANINNVDFTKFAHLSDLENYYDKATMDQKLAQAGKLKQISVNGGTPISPDEKGIANINVPEIKETYKSEIVDLNQLGKGIYKLINVTIKSRLVPQSILNGFLISFNSPNSDSSGCYQFLILEDDIHNIATYWRTLDLKAGHHPMFQHMIDDYDLTDLNNRITSVVQKNKEMTINGIMQDSNGNYVLPSFENPNFKYTKNQNIDIDYMITPSIIHLTDTIVSSTINPKALENVPKNSDGTITGFLLINMHDPYNVNQILIINTGIISPDLVIATRSISTINQNYRPDFRRILNSDDYSNFQNQITEIKQSMMRSWTGTLTQYQALTSYDPMTMYFIISDYEVVVK
ncbi:hypothetical protein [uncultured Lactobacillus sp.]|uniref:phage upper tail fiber protein n=1 Tax=uncultured Lactobacillus sp. TaxID=153152 RepID=UPI0025CE0B9E|nr:hypothetical protein [uncultured Lactobacillus sp.]